MLEAVVEASEYFHGSFRVMEAAEAMVEVVEASVEVVKSCHGSFHGSFQYINNAGDQGRGEGFPKCGDSRCCSESFRGSDRSF